MTEIDLDTEGLLDGVPPDARGARAQLICALLDDGCTVAELKQAIAQNRLALLPSERWLQRGERFVERYTAEDVAHIAEVDLEDLRAANGALGVPLARTGERCYTEADVELAKLLKVGLDAGFPVTRIAELNRVIARGVIPMAAASRTIALEAALEQGMSEHEAALLWARAAELLVPNTTRVIALAYEAHLRRLAREVYISAADIVAGSTPGAREICVAFADLVGFTKLGQSIAPEDLGKIAYRLEETAASVLRPGVSIIKTIGDAVMAVSLEPGPLIDTMIDLVDETRPAREQLPRIRAGVSAGPALERAGDWYGDVVNLASRITGVAEPGTVLVTEELHRMTADEYKWAPVGPPKLKGVERTPRLYRVMRT